MSALPPPELTDAAYRELFERGPDAALLLDATGGRVLDANGRACALFGYDRGAFRGRALPTADGADGPVPEYLRRAAAGQLVLGAAAAHPHADGTAVRAEVSAAGVVLAGRPLVLALYRPAADRDGEHQAHKMELVGRLAGGVAHDFNNLLTVISGYADVLTDGLPADDPSAEPLAEICSAARRATALTRQLLAFSRKQVLRPQPVRADEAVQGLRKMLARLIGEDVRLVTAADPDLPPVRVDPGQFEQVLMNLAVNARDAMPGGGTLTIECRGPARGLAPDGFVRVAVSDTGCGMPDEVKARVFEPFFTTKGPGKGTGLGLATVFGIVQQSGGRIAVESAVGAGTAFHLDFPLAAPAPGPAAEPPPARAAGAAPAPAAEPVLLVEDEDTIRMLALHALQAAGYTVLDAENGEQALRVVQSFGVPIRLLITDVVMPGLGGRELATRLQVAQPWIEVLYMSGYTDDEVLRHGVETDQVHFLQKPFPLAALTQRVRDILSSRDRSAENSSQPAPAV